MRREMLGLVLLFLLAVYSLASISWYWNGNAFDGVTILLTGIMASSVGGTGALLFYRWRTHPATEP